MDDFRLVLVTAPDENIADSLAKGLVEKKLAACVSEVPGLISRYYWAGKLQKDKEILLIIKTRAPQVPGIISYVKKNHSAQLPEIISLPIAEGEKGYLEWLRRQL